MYYIENKVSKVIKRVIFIKLAELLFFERRNMSFTHNHYTRVNHELPYIHSNFLSAFGDGLYAVDLNIRCI